jgi:hypothetical protein
MPPTVSPRLSELLMVVAKVTRGSDPKGLARYLLGPSGDESGRNVHTDPRVIASWRGDLEMGPAEATQLGRRLDELAERHGHGETAKRVWHGSLRAAPRDRVLGDAEWAEAAEQLVAANGLEGCRWVAVRHDDDHIHVAAVMVGRDARRQHARNDYHRSAEAARWIEQRFGLAQVESPDRSARPERSRTDDRIAARLGLDQPVKAELRDRVTAAAAASSGRDDFAGRLAASGVKLRWRRDSQQRITGYAVALEGHCNAEDEPVWHSAGRLSKHLSYGSLDRRWRFATAAGGDPVRIVDHVTRRLASGRIGVGEASSTLADLTSVAARMVPGRGGQALRLAARAGDRARAQPGGGSPAPPTASQAAIRTLAVTGPTGQLLARVAGAWRQLAAARQQDEQATSAAAAAAAAAAVHRAGAAEPSVEARTRGAAVRDHARGPSR